MMHAKKVVLVPYDLTEKKKPIEGVMKNINTKMKHILGHKDMAMDVKLAQYNQLLQNYHKSLKSKRKPYELTINELKAPIADQDILKGMPKTQLKQAQNLLNFVKHNPQIDVDHDGNVSINGEILRDANIIELIHDFSRNTKAAPAPGAMKFAEALMKLHVPLDIVGNKYRHALFTVDENDDDSDDDDIFWDE